MSEAEAEGAEIVEGLIDIDRKDVILLLESGYLLMELNRYKEAEEVFVGTQAIVPDSEVPHIALGHLFFTLGRFQPALKSHKKAIELNPESAPAHAAVGETLLFLRKFDEAMTHLDRATELGGEEPAGQLAVALKEAHSMGVFG